MATQNNVAEKNGNLLLETAVPTRNQAIPTFAFLLILADALITYLLIVHYKHLPILTIVPLLIILHLVTSKEARVSVQPKLFFYLLFGYLGFSMGMVTIDDFNTDTFKRAAGAYSSWVFGYWVFLNRDQIDRFLYPVLLITAVHVAVCLIALVGVSPALFPTFDHIWAHEGELKIRPAVTTDQNFQVFYFFPLVGIVFAAKRPLLVLVSLAFALIAAIVLAMIQTRSGLLTFLGSFFAGWLILLIARDGNRVKALALAAISIPATLVLFVLKYDMLQNIVIRFTSGDYTTGLSRFHSFLYFFEKIGNPIWWLPQGNAEYLSLTGNIPHSNITAQLVDGGILALITWVALVVIPTVMVYLRALRLGSDPVVVFVAVVAAGMLVAQMSLNAPLADQVWLWGGAAYGVCATSSRLQDQRT